MTATFLLNELKSVANPEKAAFLQRFFKTGPGEYAEGDIFLGLVTPLVRSIVKSNRQTPLSELSILMQSEYHEARACALLILVEQFKRAKEEERSKIYDFYLEHRAGINNWDLVDITCPHIVGAWLLDKDRSVLYDLVKSSDLWEQRIAMVSTITFIRKRDYADALALATELLVHTHDLMHKAVGWMLREIGKRGRAVLSDFLNTYASRMPRTALRYAIEHYPEQERQFYLKIPRLKK